MEILLLAPQPFYQDRGTQIAVDALLKITSERGDRVTLVTYHEGAQVEYENVTIHRTLYLPFIRNIQAGFSWKKVICDTFMLFKVLPIVLRRNFDYVHAVEESVFIALLLKMLFKIPYLYDMDSALSQQMVEQFPWLGPFRPFLEFCERIAVKHAEVVVPVCASLAEMAQRHQARKVVTLHDVPMTRDESPNPGETLRKQLGIEGTLLLYVGNLQIYQGIDLLLESFVLALNKTDRMDLVIIGGASADIKRYKEMAQGLGIQRKVHFLGPKPIEYLGSYLSEADILVSPRIRGENTPMKIYSYLSSEKPLLATNLPTHTQVVDGDTAMLAEPTPAAFSEGILRLQEDIALRTRLGRAGKNLVDTKYSYASFREKSNMIFDWMEGASVNTRSNQVSLPSSKQLY